MDTGIGWWVVVFCKKTKSSYKGGAMTPGTPVEAPMYTASDSLLVKKKLPIELALIFNSKL